MITATRHTLRLAKAACILARYDALVPPEFGDQIPPAIRLLARIAKIVPVDAGKPGKQPEEASPGRRLAGALSELGPTYIKLGQFLATRPDIIGQTLAADLKELQDRLPPFETGIAEQIIEAEFNRPCRDLFTDFGNPVAAASIAQVHKACISVVDSGETKEVPVAVKVLRPEIERKFSAELETFAFAARFAEKWFPDSRRLEPVKLIETLRASVELEMDLRLEAAAASEMAERNIDRPMFRVPQIDWERTGRRVLTSEWIDAVPLGNLGDGSIEGIDRISLARTVVQIFLHQSLTDGFFHADMHQGNLFVDSDGRLVAVDFGIMGRLDKQTRRYLAEILFGFLTQDYERLAKVHFDAGYVPPGKSLDAFAQALRSVGEPIFGREASKISMGRLLGQLFQVTDVFDMKLQPQLVLLQKTMVVVEGVARDLDPDLNMWETARPVVENWMKAHLSPEARLKEAADAALSMAPVISQIPDTLRSAQQITAMISGDGLRLHPETARAIANEKERQDRPLRMAAWLGAGALAVIALLQLLG